MGKQECITPETDLFKSIIAVTRSSDFPAFTYISSTLRIQTINVL